MRVSQDQLIKQLVTKHINPLPRVHTSHNMAGCRVTFPVLTFSFPEHPFCLQEEGPHTTRTHARKGLHSLKANHSTSRGMGQLCKENPAAEVQLTKN